MDYILVKVRADKQLDNGAITKTSDTYLTSALTFTEAEARIYKETSSLYTGDFDISAVSKKKYVDVYFDTQGQDEDCRWYECRTNFITTNEKTGAEKRTPANYLVCAPDLHMALSRFDGYMRGTLADFELIAVIETPILDVFTDTNNAQ